MLGFFFFFFGLLGYPGGSELTRVIWITWGSFSFLWKHTCTNKTTDQETGREWLGHVSLLGWLRRIMERYPCCDLDCQYSPPLGQTALLAWVVSETK